MQRQMPTIQSTFVRETKSEDVMYEEYASVYTSLLNDLGRPFVCASRLEE